MFLECLICVGLYMKCFAFIISFNLHPGDEYVLLLSHFTDEEVKPSALDTARHIWNFTLGFSPASILPAPSLLTTPVIHYHQCLLQSASVMAFPENYSSPIFLSVLFFLNVTLLWLLYTGSLPMLSVL